jgi:predicted nucleotidyltransferase
MKIASDPDRLAAFCRRWRIARLELFGSVLREDFGPQSDVDVLVTFDAGSNWSLFDHLRMQEELAALLERPIDFVSRHAVERSSNWIRREAILSTAEPWYEAG